MVHIKAMAWGVLLVGVIWGLIFLLGTIGLPAWIAFFVLVVTTIAYSIGRLILLILEDWDAS